MDKPVFVPLKTSDLPIVGDPSSLSLNSLNPFGESQASKDRRADEEERKLTREEDRLARKRERLEKKGMEYVTVP